MPSVKPASQRLCPAQLRAARAILGWTQARLAEAAGVSLRTVKTLEAEGEQTDLLPLPCRPATEARLRTAFEQRGVAFAWPRGAVTVSRACRWSGERSGHQEG